MVRDHGLVALSIDAGRVRDDDQDALMSRARELLERRTMRRATSHHVAGGDVGVLTAGYEHTPAANDSLSFHLCREAATGTPTPRRAGSLAGPPFAIVTVVPPGTVFGRVDACGLRHLYWTQTGGWAALSTSSTLLAQLVGSGPADMAIGAFALTGQFLGTATPYDGVEKLDAGRPVVELSRGTARLHDGAPEPAPESFGNRDEAVSEGRRAIAASVASCLEVAPRAAMELSGGLDSRMVLAALPPDQRVGRRAFTIGAPGSTEISVARHLARDCGLEHTVLDTSPLAELSPEDAGALTRGASRRRDHSTNPLAGAVLDWVEAQLPQGPRLTGQNGEFARGFYYAGQRDRVGGATDERIERLARWRLFTNDVVAGDVFVPGFLEDARADAIRGMQDLFRDYPGSWLQATDAWYLHQRMQRWVGAHYSTACSSRIILPPFFQPDFLEWARRCRPEWKRGSTLFAQLLCQLDPHLGTLATAVGPPPRSIACPRVQDRASQWLAVGGKIQRKARQRLWRRGKPASGSNLLRDQQWQTWTRGDDLTDALARLPFIDVEGLARRLSGQAPDSATVGFLVAMEGVASVLPDAAP